MSSSRLPEILELNHLLPDANARTPADAQLPSSQWPDLAEESPGGPDLHEPQSSGGGSMNFQFFPKVHGILSAASC